MIDTTIEWEPRYSQEHIKKQMEDNMKESQCETISGALTIGAQPMYFGGIDMATPKFYQVKIDKVANGFVIEIGCKKFVAEKWDDLAKKLAEYWRDPVAAKKKYCK